MNWGINHGGTSDLHNLLAAIEDYNDMSSEPSQPGTTSECHKEILEEAAFAYTVDGLKAQLEKLGNSDFDKIVQNDESPLLFDVISGTEKMCWVFTTFNQQFLQLGNYGKSENT